MAYRDPAAFQAIIDAIGAVTVGLPLRPDRSRGRGGAIVRQLGGHLGAGGIHALGDRAQRSDRRGGKGTPPDRADYRLPPKARAKTPRYARETGVDAVGLRRNHRSARARRPLPAGLPVQGNLDPLLLLAGADELTRQAHAILEAFADRPHIFNLGHGIGQFTPVEHVEHLLGLVRDWRA